MFCLILLLFLIFIITLTLHCDLSVSIIVEKGFSGEEKNKYILECDVNSDEDCHKLLIHFIISKSRVIFLRLEIICCPLMWKIRWFDTLIKVER